MACIFRPAIPDMKVGIQEGGSRVVVGPSRLVGKVGSGRSVVVIISWERSLWRWRNERLRDPT